MTPRQKLAWCYLNAAIAACGSANVVRIDSLLHRFCELAGFEPITVETWGPMRVSAIDGLTQIALHFGQECEKASAAKEVPAPYSG